MTGVRGLLVLFLIVALAGCASTGPRTYGSYKVGVPYQVNGVWYTPKEQPNYDKEGLASWYGPGFNGHRTANGERYNQRSLTAAHPTLPMPVNVRVTNLDNGRSLVVRVNDRGPFHPGRIIDVSERAAELLGFKNRGTARVRVEYIGRVDQKDETMMAARAPQKPQSAPTSRVASAAPGGPSMAPIPNPVSDTAPVANAAPWVKPIQDPQPSTEPDPGLRGPRLVFVPGPQPISQSNSTRGAGPLANAPDSSAMASLPEPPAASANSEPETIPPAPPAGSRLYVQVGAFRNSANAVALYNQVLGLGKAFVASAEVGGQQIYRVLLGPVADADEAWKVNANLKAHGHSGAQIVME